ncbi:major intrinsic protein superfamily membrane channel protein [Hygrophoropsis aurantiaca]|uniref:Major intrinsic protein superfamily membrane channel protein n=1 Tax=Hygrophoropsis aurantiaca TaxID=72124 RepID=A0ACB8AMA4_9AGAM|nr:major intrinsic protein superfamily membrane channel protein [Hygrophoropsis aurantiaca]
MSGIQEKHEQRRSDDSSYTRQTDAQPIDFSDCTHCTRYPNKWSSIREFIREPAAEFLGTMILVIFGCGGDCQVVLSSSTAVASSPKGGYLSLNLGWAIGVALGVWVCGGITGGHINPAVTLALASVRGFPWKKVPFYILAQLLGGICGAGMVYGNYFHAINLYEGGRDIRTINGTGNLFATYAADYMTPVSCFFAEFLGSAMLIITILCVTDKHNGPPPAGLVPLVLFFVILGIGLALGMETGYAVNPARDLGPRILTAMVGYGSAVFTFRNQYWLWCSILGPVLGMQIGALVYDSLIFTGSESIVNKPNAEAERKHLRGCPGQRNKIPAGVDVV